VEIDLNGRKINLLRAFPLVRKDWEALAPLGATWGRLASVTENPAAVYAYATYIVLKADPEASADDVARLTSEQLIDLLKVIRQTELAKGIDVPFSVTSTSSPEPTDGP